MASRLAYKPGKGDIMERTREEQIEVADEIIRQLGGRKFTVMTGAKDYMALESGLRFRLPGGGGFTKQGINRVEIDLQPDDLYTVRFSKIRFTNRIDLQTKTVSEFFGIYNDQLQPLFTSETGLNTHL